MRRHFLIFCAAGLQIMSSTPSLATHTYCAVTERTSDGFVNIRRGPGADYKIVGKVLPSHFLWIGTEECRDDFGQMLCSKSWVFVESAQGLGAVSPSTLKGWIKESLVRQVACPD
jgi:hypothetical protein